MPQPRIFVSHSHKDDAFTERLVTDLQQAGANTWMDMTGLGAGNFQQRIDEALAGCEWFVLVLTRDALTSPWVQQEVYAANRLKNHGQIHDLIFIQAGPVDHRGLPPTWGVFNIFDATKNYAWARDWVLWCMGLYRAAQMVPDMPIQVQRQFAPSPEYPTGRNSIIELPKSLGYLGFQLRMNRTDIFIQPPVCAIPAGPFLMGSDPRRDRHATPDEQPQHMVTLPAYDIARFPVTVAEYACYLENIDNINSEDGRDHCPKQWQAQAVNLDHPVVGVLWDEAAYYADWLSKCTGELWQLPSEEEWEKAARGTDGRIYPWGDAFDPVLCNTRESGINTTTPVGNYPHGTSPYGAQDMAGNVLEWINGTYREYEWSGEEDDVDPYDYMWRGGGWAHDAKDARATCRCSGPSYTFLTEQGFRLMRVAPNS